VHHGPFLPVRIGEPLQLRNAPGQRHLAPLEADLGLVASLVALGAAPRGLSLARGDPSPHALAGPPRAGRRPQVVQLHVEISSTSTRWRTLAIIPRISGRSSFSTLSPMRCRPKARTVAFWSRVGLVALRRCVTFTFGTGHPLGRG